MSTTSDLVINGIISGFLGAVAMLILMMVGRKMNLSPMDLPSSLGKMIIKGKKEGDSTVRKAGIAMHLIIGSLWGLLFVFLTPFYQFGLVPAGLMFGVAIWLLMQIIALPMMGAGFFGSKFGMKVPIMSLIMHLVYGLVLVFFVQAIGYLQAIPI